MLGKPSVFLLILSALLLGACFQSDPPVLNRPQRAGATPYVQKDIVVDGMRLRYVDEGSGFPLVLIPGHSSRVEEYDALIRYLLPKGGWRIITLDFPGSGYSDKPDREYSLAFYEDTFLHFLDALGIAHCHLAGGSLGGHLTLRLGARDPERFRRLIAFSPAGAWAARPWLAWATRLIAGRPLFWPTVKIQSRFWYSKHFSGSKQALEETFERYFPEVLSRGFLRMYWGMAADQIGHSLFPIAPAISQPTLLISADEDPTPGMVAGVRRLKELIPNSQLIELTGVGHAVATERTQELARLIEAFLKEDPGKARRRPEARPR
ncbi:MAG: alpha/beta hydrolase [Elusimicrobia bacterium]|nr:alpha/beta hydrolase [Elusimicrobiota bacterium]